ncbi:MAG: DUF3071 domain-containing protein [Propionibacteriaceae bacterium]|jgi:hypothetical protein|nr:DUF3071 domain-containing protein [Propionibacteriaceae bacterium]
MESALSPREIQQKVRSGLSVSEVAAEAGVPEEQIEAFAVPVIAEREFIAEQASKRPVRRGGDTIPHHTLAEVVAEKLSSEGFDPDASEWDSWKVADRRWRVQITYGDPADIRKALFNYDQSGRFSEPENRDASWLVGMASPAARPRRRPQAESEKTVKLNTPDPIDIANEETAPLAEVHEVTEPIATTDDAYSEGELSVVDGVLDFTPTQTGGIDVLYDMLSSFDEDSVTIYRGLLDHGVPAPEPEPAPVHKSRRTSKPKAEPAAQTEPAEPETAETSEAEQLPLIGESTPAPKPKKKRGRAKVPSWDEIVFGSPKKKQ